MYRTYEHREARIVWSEILNTSSKCQKIKLDECLIDLFNEHSFTSLGKST